MPVNGFTAPLRYERNIKPGLRHPLAGMPIEMVSQLHDIDIESPIFGYFQDFYDYQGPFAEGAQAEWTLFGNVGVATIVHDSGEPTGVIRLVTGTTEDDNAMLRQNQIDVFYSTSANLWLAARINLIDADDQQAFFGIAEDGNDFVASLPTYGLFFFKDETQTNFDFHVRTGGTSTVISNVFTGLTLTDLGWITLAIRVEDGNITPWLYEASLGWVKGTTVAKDDANVPGAAEDMSIQFGVETGAAALRYMSIDWLAYARDVN